MAALYLIVVIAGQRVALLADDVESVVEIGAITPVPLVAPHVAGLSALRSRVLTIVDSLAALELGTAPLEGLLQAVIVTVDGHLYGLLVDQVDDVIEVAGAVQPIQLALSSGWARAARGMVELAGEALLLVDPAALIVGPQALAA